MKLQPSFSLDPLIFSASIVTISSKLSLSSIPNGNFSISSTFQAPSTYFTTPPSQKPLIKPLTFSASMVADVTISFRSLRLPTTSRSRPKSTSVFRELQNVPLSI